MRHRYRSIILAILTVPAFMLGSLAMASGTRGGGDVIEIPVDGQQRLELYDLVAQYTCDWQSGQQMIDANPRLTVALNHIGKLDWYLALSLRQTIESLDFCLTGSLMPIYRKFKTTPDKNAIRAAFRIGHNVLWDQQLADQLSPRSRAFLIIHEASHSYLSMNMDYHERYIKLWSAVKTLSLAESGAESGAFTRDELHYQLRKDSMEYPFATDALDAVEPQLKFLLGDLADQTKDVIATQSPENLIAVNLAEHPQVEQDLDPSDNEFLKSINFKDVLIRTLQTAMVTADTTGFNRLLQKTYSTIDITLVALAIEPQLSPDKRERLDRSGDFVASFNQVYGRLIQQKVTPSDPVVKRPTVSADFIRLISAQGPDGFTYTPIVDLSPTSQLATELQGLARIVAMWIKNGQWYDVDITVTNNPKFYEALGLKSQRRELALMSPTVAREKPLADEVLVELRDRLIHSFTEAVSQDLNSQDLMTQFENRIDANRFKLMGKGA